MDRGFSFDNLYIVVLHLHLDARYQLAHDFSLAVDHLLVFECNVFCRYTVFFAACGMVIYICTIE